MTLLSFVIPVPRHWDPVFHMIPSRTLCFNITLLCLPTQCPIKIPGSQCLGTGMTPS
ncbi:hypothetical protein [Wolbachia endosymbiont of Dactylopius coccus]